MIRFAGNFQMRMALRGRTRKTTAPGAESVSVKESLGIFSSYQFPPEILAKNEHCEVHVFDVSVCCDPIRFFDPEDLKWKTASLNLFCGRNCTCRCAEQKSSPPTHPELVLRLRKD